MVQRKAPQKIVPQSQTERSHDSRTKGGGGGGGGGDDLKKKKMMKLERSIRAADLETLHGSSPPNPTKPGKTSPSKTSPNYMKPTSSSDARKEQLQVTPILRKTTTDCRKRNNPKNSNPSSPTKLLIKKLKGVVVVNRATCSSTLKDSKFPKALDLNPGGAEAEGTSAMRVCPFTYCSLNGHRHEPLPPLRCFVSARRKLIKTQKSMKLKGYPSFRVKGLGRDKKEIGLGNDDFFVDIYTSSKPNEEIIDEIKSNEGFGKESEGNEDDGDEIVEDDEDQSSEISNDRVDVMIGFLEYVEGAKEESNPSLVTQDCGEMPVNGSGKACEDMAGSENKASTFDFDWEEELKSLFPDNVTECSEYPDDGSVEQADGEIAREVNPQAPGDDNLESDVIDSREDDVMNQASKLQEVEISEENDPDVTCSDENLEGSEEVVSEEPEEASESGTLNLDGFEKQNLHKAVEDIDNEKDEDTDASLGQIVHFCHDIEELYQGTTEEDDGETQGSHNTEEEEVSIAKLKARTRIRKKATDEVNQIRDFNPRGPNFLDVEPDPDAEKVDLRHQMTEERKNSEEWMIDYALRRAVTKLASDRKKKVALIVEAIETVMPIPSQEKPVPDAAPSGFVQARIMQACS